MKTTEEILAWVDARYNDAEAETKGCTSFYGVEDLISIMNFIDELREFITSKEEK